MTDAGKQILLNDDRRSVHVAHGRMRRSIMVQTDPTDARAGNGRRLGEETKFNSSASDGVGGGYCAASVGWLPCCWRMAFTACWAWANCPLPVRLSSFGCIGTRATIGTRRTATPAVGDERLRLVFFPLYPLLMLRFLPLTGGNLFARERRFRWSARRQRRYCSLAILAQMYRRAGRTAGGCLFR